MAHGRTLAGTRVRDRRMLALALGASIALAALPALAGTTTDQENSAAGMRNESPAEIQAFNAAKLSLPQAIAAVQKQSHGKVLDMTFETKSGTPMYDATVWANNAEQMWSVDANTGKVTKSTEAPMPQAKLDQQDKTELHGVKSAKIDLSQAVRAAEQKSGGKAIDAGIQASNGIASYDVQTVKGGAVQAFTVNPQNGMAQAQG